MDVSIVIAVVGLCASLVSVVFAALASKRNERQDNKSEGKSEGLIMSDIGYIKSSVERMEKNLTSVDERYRNIVERVAKTEENLVNVHKRLDEIIGKEGG